MIYQMYEQQKFFNQKCDAYSNRYDNVYSNRYDNVYSNVIRTK